ncbi:MAG: M36 family metallopeptidase, partial [Dokdonella sp.]
ALTLFATPAEPIAGNYALGAYSAFLLTPGFVDNNFYGIRRFPYAIFSVTGGPMNRPFAPQTFADFFPAQLNLSDGAYPPAPRGDATSQSRGEIWALALLEARARLIARLGYVQGNQRMLQFVVDGIKLSPLNPDFIQARDALLAAASAGGTAQDVADVCTGLAVRGLGSSASSTLTSVVESFTCTSDVIFSNGFDG